METWKSLTLEIGYHLFGWIAFFSWAIGFYPQIILNYRRKSVVGLNFDFLVLNLTKQSSYLIFNASLFFSPVVQRQYHQKYGFGEMIPVAANDVAFSAHSLLLTSIVLCQVLIYEKSLVGFSATTPTVAITAVVWVSVAVYVFIAWPHQSWLWLISVFNKYKLPWPSSSTFPRYVLLNFKRKSTDGWAIDCILLDLTGGVTIYAQMLTQSINKGSFVNFYENLGKSLLSAVTIFYDLIFLFQHYVLYPSKEGKISSDSEVAPNVDAALLIKSSDPSSQENV